jgi:DNA repair exonuclease SbcCD nuclease subunit
MALKILLTSDLHLGMKFASLPEVGSLLAEARFLCLKRLVDLANTRKCGLLVVAGDLFERTSVPKRDVQRAAGALADFQGALVAVLPGNHDYFSAEDELWKRFREAGGNSLLLLEEERPYSLSSHGLDACLYPGPCVSKHSKANAVSWIKEAERDKKVRHHIGVAHGSLEGVSPDFKSDYYPMKTSELHSYGLDLWLLGHTHARHPKAPTARDRVFIAGTPEPDGFDCGHEGSAWLIQVSGDGAVSSEALSTGAYRFVHENAEIRGPADLAAIVKRLVAAPDAKHALLKAVLSGRLAPEAHGELEESRKKLAESFFSVSWDVDGVREEVTGETIEREFSAGSFPYRLLQGLVKSGDAESLELAYELLQEARG